MASLRIILACCLLSMVAGKGSKPKIKCMPDLMRVEVPMDANRKLAYLEQLKEYPPCMPEVVKGMATFDLDLQDPHACGVTRVVNKLTGKKVFYHKIIVETDEGSESISARCVVTPTRSLKVKRAADLPAGFQEPDYINVTMSLTNTTAIPQLGVAVKQAGKVVSGEISVSPGTPLSMEIFLDKKSAPIYGILVSYMQATDTKQLQETIIFNGCSVDTYLFDNFLTEDGDVLAAKFRAFKFPDTLYVQFKGTVTVCLDKCQGVVCNNGVTGYGKRRRRAVDQSGADPNKIFEISLTTFIKVDRSDEADKVTKLLRELRVDRPDHQSRSIYKTLDFVEEVGEHEAAVRENEDFKLDNFYGESLEADYGTGRSSTGVRSLSAIALAIVALNALRF